MDGEDDHVHLLVEYPPKIAVSNLVNGLKGLSSRLLRKERPDIQKSYWKGVLWSPSYFASSCGGTPISIIASTSSNRHPTETKNLRIVRAILPRPQRRGLSRIGSQKDHMTGCNEEAAQPAFKMPAAFEQELSAEKTAAIRAELAYNSTVRLATVVHALLLSLYSYGGHEQTTRVSGAVCALFGQRRCSITV